MLKKRNTPHNIFCTKCLQTVMMLHLFFLWRGGMYVLFGKYTGPQLSQQKRNTHSNNKLITTITNSTHQNQIVHSPNKILTAQTNFLTTPRKRCSIVCLIQDLYFFSLVYLKICSLQIIFIYILHF